MPTEKDPGEIFTIAGWSAEIYDMILPRTGTGSDMKLSQVPEILDRIAGDVLSPCRDFPPPLANKVRALQPDRLSRVPIFKMHCHVVY
jgi:hypothetical protein